MRMRQVLHRTILDSVPGLHAKRADALLATAQSLLAGAFPTGTALGRGLQSAVCIQHNIKRMDRRLANAHRLRECSAFHRVPCRRLRRDLDQPKIPVQEADVVEPMVISQEIGNMTALLRADASRLKFIATAYAA